MYGEFLGVWDCVTALCVVFNFFLETTWPKVTARMNIFDEGNRNKLYCMDFFYWDETESNIFNKGNRDKLLHGSCLCSPELVDETESKERSNDTRFINTNLYTYKLKNFRCAFNLAYKCIQRAFEGLSYKSEKRFLIFSQGGFRRGSWDLFECEYVFKVIEKLLSEIIRSYPVPSPPVSSPLGGGVPTNLSPTYFTDRVEKFISRLCNSILFPSSSIQEASNENWFPFFY